MEQALFQIHVLHEIPPLAKAVSAVPAAPTFGRDPTRPSDFAVL